MHKFNDKVNPTCSRIPCKGNYRKQECLVAHRHHQREAERYHHRRYIYATNGNRNAASTNECTADGCTTARRSPVGVYVGEFSR